MSRRIVRTPIRGAFLLVSACLLASPAHAIGDDCRFRAERGGGVDLAGVEKVVVRAGAGDLKIVGREDARRLEARGQACAYSEELLAKIELSVRREGSTAFIETVMPEGGMVFAGSWSATLDLGVALPPDVPVEVTDSAGDAEIERVASLYMTDSSGDLCIREIAKNVEIEADSSGDLKIEGIGGNVRVRRDSSGDIRIADVKGNAEVDADSSGSIVAHNVGGDFSVGTDGSGRIDYSEVHGRVRVPQFIL